ncbi:copper chaperone PCu(A)C [Aureimonas sp. SK2]|uniref:copper chaperone PCu(A)C n=1 Tax=Aureimonas sp. SK2 TaxID=3015992 RepID=UPI002444DDD4|nr:copper chaperone PCu(A)C [Aureimonas sp. SK2]
MPIVRPWMVLLVSLSLTDMSIAARPASASSVGFVAEKAIVTVPRDGDGDLEGYLVVWNGVAGEARLETVTSDAFSRVQFVQHSDKSRNGVKEGRSGVSIPGHSELVMLQRGIHMHLTPKGAIAVGNVVTLELKFGDGTVQTLSATVEGDRNADDLHHHDQSSAEWLSKLDGLKARESTN